MKIALIMVKGRVYQFDNRSSLFKYMPDSLTLGDLYGIIEKNFPDVLVEIYDESVENIDIEKINADLVGISAVTPAINRAYEYSDYFMHKNIPVFIGGIHATLCPSEVSEHCSSVIVGLAQESLVELINDFSKNNLRKFYYQKQDMSFSNFPHPKRHIYEDKHWLGTELNMVQASYGCSNICEFCVQPYVCCGYHQRPVDDVIEEIKEIEDGYIEFYDPNLSKDRSYLKELCEKLIPLKKQWFAPMTIAVAKDDELLDLMKRSGCCEILIGFESVNEASISSINKGFNRVGDYKKMIKRLHDYGIMVRGSFVMGLDCDDESVFDKTLEFIIDANIDYVRFSISTPYPGTVFYNKLKEQNRIIEDDLSLYDCHNCVFEPINMSPETLENGFRNLWKNAYSLKNICKRLSYMQPFSKRLKHIFLNYNFGRIYKKMVFKDKEFIKNIKLNRR